MKFNSFLQGDSEKLGKTLRDESTQHTNENNFHHRKHDLN